MSGGSGFRVGGRGSDRLKDVDVVFSTANLLRIAAARLVAFLLVAGRLCSNESAAPALVSVLDTGEENSAVHGCLPA